MTDYIDRQAAIDELHMNLMYRMGTDSNKQRLDEWINNLPSAEPERKWGEWIMIPAFENMRCSNCKIVFGDEMYPRNYCPNCGAEMTRGKE